MKMSELDKHIRKSRMNEVVGFFRQNGDNFRDEKYFGLSTIDRLALIANAIERINPTYRAYFNSLEDKKPEDRQIKLPEDFTLADMVESADGIETTEKALEIFYANRLAHTCRDTQKKMIYDFLEESNEEDSMYPSMQYDLNDSRKIDRIIHTAQKYFIAETRTPEGTKVLQRRLAKDGIDADGIKTLRSMGYGVLANGFMDCMYAKDQAISDAIDLLREDGTQSYGLKQTTDKQGRNSYLFVMDVPCFGQMSVHMFNQGMVSDLSDHIYRYPVYQLDNVLLVDGTSKFQERFIYEHTDDLIETLKGLKSKKDAHEIAVKAGLTKDEIAQLYSSDENKGEER